MSRPPRSWCARGQSPLALLSVGPWRLKAGQRPALQGPSRCREQQRPAVAGGVSAEQVSTTSESEVEDEDKSSQSGDRRVHGETGHSNPCKVSRHSSATVLNAQVAEHDQPRGSPQESWGRRPCLLPSPCTRTSSRASSDFILCRYAPDARALPPSAPADRALTIHCLCSGGPIASDRRRLQLAERRRRGQEACRTVAGGSTGSNATPGAH